MRDETIMCRTISSRKERVSVKFGKYSSFGERQGLPAVELHRFMFHDEFGRVSRRVKAPRGRVLYQIVHFYYWIQKNQGDVLNGKAKQEDAGTYGTDPRDVQ